MLLLELSDFSYPLDLDNVLRVIILGMSEEIECETLLQPCWSLVGTFSESPKPAGKKPDYLEPCECAHEQRSTGIGHLSAEWHLGGLHTAKKSPRSSQKSWTHKMRERCFHLLLSSAVVESSPLRLG